MSVSLAANVRCLAPEAARSLDIPGPVHRVQGRRVYSFPQMVHAVRVFHLQPRAAIDALRSMVERSKLPAPITARPFRGRMLSGAQAVCKKALWDAAEVDQALTARHAPPALTIVGGTEAGAATRDLMRERARRLAGALA